MTRSAITPTPKRPRHGIARVLSKLGVASRTQAAQWVLDGRVRVNGRTVRDPQFPVRQGEDSIAVDERSAVVPARRVIMLNKPSGLVTTTRDERGRDTVYSCLAGCDFPWLAPVGRLDKASEGLLLFSNDPIWAARITAPAARIKKTYHVQINCLPADVLLAHIQRGVQVDGVLLAAKTVRILRRGTSNAWLEIILEEGRNRQIRRLLGALDVSVLRLMRVAIGSVVLGNLPKGQWREILPDELEKI